MAEKGKTAKGDYWKGLKSEFQKITWPDREAIGKQTLMVVCVSLVMGAIIAVLDYFLQQGVDFIVGL